MTHTARHHVENVMGKMGVATRAAVLPALLAGVHEAVPTRIYAWTPPTALPLAA